MAENNIAKPTSRALVAVPKADREKFPQLDAAWKNLQETVKAQPQWGAEGATRRLPSASVFLQGKKDAPATVERREQTLVKMGCPDNIRVAVVAAMVRYHDAWKAAGIGIDKVAKKAAAVIDFD